MDAPDPARVFATSSYNGGRVVSEMSYGSQAAPRILNWIPAALAVAMIAAESTATMSAANTSRWLMPFWVHLFGSISDARWDEVHHLIRKFGHFFGYGLVSVCFFHGWRTSLRVAEGAMRSLWRRASLLAVGSTLLVASADEFHQSFLPSRTSSPVDVGIDVGGAILAQLVILAIMPLFTRKRELVAVSA
jgi:VanZ family protein